jgi:ELWxxDGT repeat protein
MKYLILTLLFAVHIHVAAQPVLVKDINTVPQGFTEGVNPLIPAGDYAYFTRFNEVNGNSELWVTDGTKTGTKVVADNSLSLIRTSQGMPGGKIIYSIDLGKHIDILIHDASSAASTLLHRFDEPMGNVITERWKKPGRIT